MRGDDHSFAGLEYLRFLAALVVIIGHSQSLFSADITALLGPFPQRLGILTFHVAVPVFWTLSGYVLFWKYHKPIGDGVISASRFAMLRLSRLYPLHLVTLLLTAVLQIAYVRFGSPQPLVFVGDYDFRFFVAQLFFASNWFTTTASFDGPVWSISVEVLIYALFYSVARLLPLHRSDTLFAIIGISAAGYWLAAHFVGGTAIWICQCAVCFFLGASLCANRISLARHPIIYMLIATAATAALYAIRPTYALDFAVPVLAVFFFSAGRFWQSRGAQSLSFVGHFTYGTYLLHTPMLALMLMIKPEARSPVFFAFYITFVFTVAGLSYRLFERPMQRWLRGLSEPLILST
jgi:peptidoglycan/LPS O-acetylase OafA/YrhL